MKKLAIFMLLASISAVSFAGPQNLKGAFFPQKQEVVEEIEGGETGGNGNGNKQQGSGNNAAASNHGNHYAYGHSKVNTPYLYYKSKK